MRFIEKKRLWMLLADVLLLNLSLWLAFSLRFDWTIPQYYRAEYFRIALFITTLRVLLLFFSGIYRGVWRYIGVNDLVNIFKAVTLGTLLIAVSSFLVRRVYFARVVMGLEWLDGYPLSVMVAEWLGDIIMIGGLRLGLRLFNQYQSDVHSRNVERKRILIVGAGDAGEMVIRQMMAHPEYGYQPVGFIDDDPKKKGREIHRIPILGGRADIDRLAEENKVQEIIIAIPSATGSVVREVVEQCHSARLKFKIVPGIKEIIEGGVSINQIRDIELEDLLRRPPVNIALDEIAGYLKNKTIMVTGAGGSIGSELCRQIVSFNPGSLLLLGKGENSLYEITTELSRSHPGQKTETLICDVADVKRADHIFAKYKPQVVFHAAAHKHVPMMEHNPGEAVKNNIFGTKAVAEAAMKYKAERFVLISTDKAVNPTSVMGATKRISEKIIMRLVGQDKTKFMAVRFGNVLGSRGSVVPLFKKQIAAGGPVTVTHPDMERYFMTIPEAVQLVIQAGAMGQGGEVFVLDMGKPVKIVDLARDMIKLSGFEPDTDIKIEFSGLRPGEKLFEELLTAEEGINATKHAQIFRVKGKHARLKELPGILPGLQKAAISGEHDKVVKSIRKVIPTFRDAENAG
ncbi:MAG: polysaccharide biosynthesis protein [Candidatus Edwardsbacteria bacterium]|nr:polysaccharide biosynthesis protein [Candidatus Edwardsbacteria bacterium]MBU1576519.1 polysaccharide biosynthesis protein [Candidatus Edwardsbacteria bacterium]MBU2593872.1 polysaccharide biosynthesis protein [Candidatus Edwardsbacteria bacterium]